MNGCLLTNSNIFWELIGLPTPKENALITVNKLCTKLGWGISCVLRCQLWSAHKDTAHDMSELKRTSKYDLNTNSVLKEG
jgi:hypothetical protein